MIFASTKEALFHFRDGGERISVCHEEAGWVRIFASIQNDDISICIETEEDLVADLKANFFDPDFVYRWRLEAEDEGIAEAVRLGLWNPVLEGVIP